MDKGCIHIYTGESQKHLKTAQGMALRACGAGFSVGFCSFGEKADDIESIASRLPGLQILKDIGQDVSQFDMIILHNCDLTDHHNLRKFLADRPKNAEIVLCGMSFPDDILTMADLVSEIVSF